MTDTATIPALKSAVAVFDHLNTTLGIKPEDVDEHVKDMTVIQLAHLIDESSGLPGLLEVCWEIVAAVEKSEPELYRKLRAILLETEPQPEEAKP